MAANVMEIYGSKVFNEHVMKERLPSATYKSLEKTLHKGAPLDIEVANVVASVMKRWEVPPLHPPVPAADRHYQREARRRWATAPPSWMELVRGEPDASSHRRPACHWPAATPHGTHQLRFYEGRRHSASSIRPGE